MESNEENDLIEIALHNLNDFGGYFTEVHLNNNKQIVRCGLSHDAHNNKCILSISGRSFVINKDDKIIINIKHLLNKIMPENNICSLCIDSEIFKLITNINPSIEMIYPINENNIFNNEIASHHNELSMIIKPIPTDFVSAYLKTLGKPFSYIDVASFISNAPYCPLTYNFLCLESKIQSVQDIIIFLKNDDYIACVFGMGVGYIEVFMISKEVGINRKIDSSEIGMHYLDIMDQYNDMHKPYAYKVAALSLFKKYSINLGYRVIWNHDKDGSQIYRGNTQ